MEYHILFSLLSLCAFFQLTLALPPFRTDLDSTFDIIEAKESITPLYRLPNNIVPSHYELEIRPILDPGYGVRFTAPGKVYIFVKCITSTDTIVLHSLDTKIQRINVTLELEGTEIPTTGDPEFDIKNQIVTIKLGGPGLVLEKLYKIYIEFTTKVAQDRHDGLYLTSYVDPITKETRYLCATDFEADDARRMFPMFDEPAMKATWIVSILRTANYHSLANHEKAGLPVPVEGEPGWFKDTYKQVVRMSSYLLAFAVSDFTSETAHPSLFDGKPVTIWGPPSIMEEGGGIYSANTSAKLIQYLEEIYESTYPLPKMDKISLPDFISGAMENWGLNTYREGRLLYLEGISTIEDKVRMTTTLSHELVHQWFGNLVTMNWWNDLWLNEGFATYFAAVGIKNVYPEYSPMESLLVNSIQPAMQADVLSTSHPISPDIDKVQNETDFSNMFSTIVYHKGASIIRMMNGFLTEDIMMGGLRKYLDTFQYNNAVQEDLFNILHEEANKTNLPNDVTLTTIMTTWTKQKGYPIVNVIREASKITFKQDKYGNPDANYWWIPITYVESGYTTSPEVDTSTKLWLGTETSDLTVTISPAEWILVNPIQIGNYRVVYDTINYDLLRDQLNGVDHAFIDPLSKSSLMDDYFNLAFAKYPGVTLIQALDLTTFLKFEEHFVPWITFLTNMGHSYRMLGRSSSFLDFRKYMLSLINPVLDKINMYEQIEDTPGGQILLRTRLVDWACNLGDSNCTEFARNLTSDWMETPNPASNNRINPDLRTTLYCSAISNGGDDVWDFIVARYKDAHDATTSVYLPDVARISLVRSLGCAKQTYKLAKLLDLALDPQSFLLNEHRLTAIQAVAGNSAGIDLTFNFLRNNFDTLERRFGVGIVLSSISTLSNYLNSAIDKKDLEAFAEKKISLKNSTSIVTSVTNIQKNIDWISDHSNVLRIWLKSKI